MKNCRGVEERRSPPSACGTDVDFEVIAVSAFSQLAIPYRRGAPARALFFSFSLSPFSARRRIPVNLYGSTRRLSNTAFHSRAAFTDFFSHTKAVVKVYFISFYSQMPLTQEANQLSQEKIGLQFLPIIPSWLSVEFLLQRMRRNRADAQLLSKTGLEPPPPSK